MPGVAVQLVYLLQHHLLGLLVRRVVDQVERVELLRVVVVRRHVQRVDDLAVGPLPQEAGRVALREGPRVVGRPADATLQRQVPLRVAAHELHAAGHLRRAGLQAPWLPNQVTLSRMPKPDHAAVHPRAVRDDLPHGLLHLQQRPALAGQRPLPSGFATRLADRLREPDAVADHPALLLPLLQDVLPGLAVASVAVRVLHG
eukprot:12945694-Alexandrium_andersonii.AAC.1